jgi:hypothetical protein
VRPEFFRTVARVSGFDIAFYFSELSDAKRFGASALTSPNLLARFQVRRIVAVL